MKLQLFKDQCIKKMSLNGKRRRAYLETTNNGLRTGYLLV